MNKIMFFLLLFFFNLNLKAQNQMLESLLIMESIDSLESEHDMNIILFSQDQDSPKVVSIMADWKKQLLKLDTFNYHLNNYVRYGLIAHEIMGKHNATNADFFNREFKSVKKQMDLLKNSFLNDYYKSRVDTLEDTLEYIKYNLDYIKDTLLAPRGPVFVGPSLYVNNTIGFNYKTDRLTANSSNNYFMAELLYFTNGEEEEFGATVYYGLSSDGVFSVIFGPQYLPNRMESDWSWDDQWTASIGLMFRNREWMTGVNWSPLSGLGIKLLIGLENFGTLKWGKSKVAGTSDPNQANSK